MQRFTPKDFESMYRLMEQSFPTDEYRPYDEQRALLNQPEYSVYIRRDSENEPLHAFISVWDFGFIAFIEHFAVDPNCRGNGIGSEMLQELIATINKPVCLEVELPETDLAKRRIAFYKRNGFFLNEYPYLQPPISNGKQAVPLLIMTTEHPIDRPAFDTIKTTLYKRVYKQP